MKAKKESDGFVYIECPGCGFQHRMAVDEPNHLGARWTFNNVFEKPTFTPSKLVTIGQDPEPNKLCHSFITDGKIRFLEDCSHHLKGQTVELPDIE